MARIRPYDRPETMKQRATLPRLLTAAYYSQFRLATTGESATVTVTHETVYSKVVLPSLSVHDSAVDYI